MASPVTIQPSGSDVRLAEDTPNSNYGGNAYLETQTTISHRQDSLLAFNVSAVVPAGATITLAILSLLCQGTVASRTITVYRLLRTDWVGTEATWNVYKAGSNWGTAGALGSGVDFTPTDAATAASVAAGQWLNETVTAQVRTALDSIGGVAHFLVADVGAAVAGANIFYGRRYATTGNRPKLYIEYTVPAVGPAFLNIGDTWKAIDFLGSKLNVGAAWKAVRTIKINIADAWGRGYSSPAVLNEDDTHILLESGTDDRIEVE